MNPLFQPPIFPTARPPPPICQWHWVIPQPVPTVVLPIHLGATTYHPVLVYHQPPQLPAPPSPQRVGLTLRVILHGQRRPSRSPGFWALALDAAYAQAPTKTHMFQHVAAWAAQHGLLPSTPAAESAAANEGSPGPPRRWAASLYVMKTAESSSAGVTVDKEAGCVVVPADKVLRAVQLSSGSGEGDEDSVKEALEEARDKGGRAVLVVDMDARPSVDV